MTHHGAGLRLLLEKKKWSDESITELIDTLKVDYTKAKVSTAEMAALHYSIKVTATPWEVTEKDIATLKSEGFDDRGIHDLCAITSYFAFVNRIADGLGVELEEFWKTKKE